MGNAQQVYAVVVGDMQGGPNSRSRYNRSGATRHAMEAFWAQATGGQTKAVLCAGDMVGADGNSATYWRMKDVWGAESESVNCPNPGSAPVSNRGSAGRCYSMPQGGSYDHPTGGAHTGYMSMAIRNITLPCPGNHDVSSVPESGVSGTFKYDGFYNFWHEKWTDDTGTKLRPQNVGLRSGNYLNGPYYYSVELPAADTNKYWRAIMIDDELYTGATGNEAAFETWLDAELADAASKDQHIIACWHEPPWLVNNGGNDYGFSATSPIVIALQGYTAGLVVTAQGHIHHYSRWNPMKWNGNATHNQQPVSVTDYQNGAGGMVNMVVGTGGQNPGGFTSGYWENVADQTYTPSGNLVIARPNGTTATGDGKAAVTSIPLDATGDADTSTGDAGQPGHPFGCAGIILDSDGFTIQWWGEREAYDGTATPSANVRQFDLSPKYTWQGVVSNAPDITSFSPTSGIVGTDVVIIGTNFTGATAVTFGGVSSSYVVTNDTHITATVPTGAATGLIQVTTPDGTAQSATSFRVTTPTTAGWRSAELYGGGGTNCVSVHPLGTRMIAGGDNSGPRVSEDGGINWTPGFGGLKDSQAGQVLQTIAVEWSRDPAFPNRAWTGNLHGFMVSTNGGYDWADVTPSSSPQGMPAFSHSGAGGGGGNRPRVVGHCVEDDGDGNVYMIDNDGDVFRFSGFGATGQGGSMTRIAQLGSVGTGLSLDPLTKTELFCATRAGVYQLQNVTTSTAAVRKFTGTGSPTRAEEVKALSEGGTVKIYVAAHDDGIKRVVRAANGSGDITTAFDTITPGAATGRGWPAVDAVSVAGSTLLVAGMEAPGIIGNGMGQVWYSANGHAGSPTWICLTANDVNSVFSNQMGGAGGAPWWGYGLRAGATIRETARQQWVTDSGSPGNVEQIQFDPVNTHKIIGVGQQGGWIFDRATKTCYPSMVGSHNAVCNKVEIDSRNPNSIIISNSDHCVHVSRTGGRDGDWHKNENGTALSPSTTTQFAQVKLVQNQASNQQRVFAGFGERFDNLMGDLYYHDDPTNGVSWVSVGGSAWGGKRPLGISVRRIGGSDVVLAAVEGGGISKRTYSTATPPAGGSWSFKNTTAFGTSVSKTRCYDIDWVTDSLAYAYDPNTGMWRSVDAGETWTKIWNCPNGDSELQGYYVFDPDNHGTLFISLGTSAGANTGIWKLTGATLGGGTVENNGITKTEIRKPNGTSFNNPGPLAVTTGGRVGFIDMAETATSRSSFLSTDGGTTLADVTDDYFRRSAIKMFCAEMGTDGRWFVTMHGPAAIVYDSETSRFGDGDTGPGGDGEGPITRTVVPGSPWFVSDPPGTSFVSNPITVSGPDKLLVVDVATSGTTASAPTSITGLGLTFTQRESDVLTASDATERRITTFTAVTDAAGTDALTVNFAGTQTGIAVHVTEYDGIDLTAGGGGGGDPVTVTKLLDNGGDDSNVNAFAIGPFTPTTGGLIGLVIGAVDNAAGGVPTITTVSDGSRTYTHRVSQAQTNTDEYKVFFYTAPTGTSTSTTITVTFDEALLGCNLLVLEFIGADNSDPIAQTNSGTGATDPDITLANAPESTSMVLAAVGIRRDPAGWTPEAGWAEHYDDASPTPANGMQVATRTADQQYVATGTNGSHWLLIAEIQAAPAAPSSDPIVQSASTNWGVTASKPTISLDSPLTGIHNAVHTANVTPRNPAAWDPETAWDEVADFGFDTPSTGIQVAGQLDSTDQTYAAAGGTNGRWGATILEIAATNAGATTREVSYDTDYILGNSAERDASTDEVILGVSVNTLTSSFTDSDVNTVNTASITAHTNAGVYVGVENAKEDGTPPEAPTLTGGSVTWNTVDSIVYCPTGNQRRRLTVFASVGTPSTGALTIAFGGVTQAHVGWVVIESVGGKTIIQHVTAQVPATETVISISITPQLPNATVLAFSAKRGSIEMEPGSSMLELAQSIMTLPGAALMAMVGGAPGPRAVTAGSVEQAEEGMVVLELSSLQSNPAVQASTDYILFGTAASEPGKSRTHKRKLSRIFVTMDAQEVPVESDWQFSETALGGYDAAAFSVPARTARARRNALEQDAPVAVFNEAGEELWVGRIERPPEFRDGFAKVDAAGPQHDARRATERLMYQICGVSDWSTMDADPYKYAIDKGIVATIGPGTLQILREKNEVSNRLDHNGFAFWVPGADISRLAFSYRKTDAMPNFDIAVRPATGPSGNFVDNITFDLGLSALTGSKSPAITGAIDLVCLTVSCNSNSTPAATENRRVWFEDVRVNGIAPDDSFSTAEVAADIAQRLGWDPAQISATDLNALPLDIVDQDWGEALDYMTLLDNVPWQAYGGPVMRRRPWDYDVFEVARERGAIVSLTPEPIYQSVRVVYTTPAGKPGEVIRQTEVGGREYPPFEMPDPQRNNDGGASDAAIRLAERMLEEYSSERYAGNIELSDSDRNVHAGRNVRVTDWDAGDALEHQIADVSQDEDKITIGVRSDQIVSRAVARMEKTRRHHRRRG